MKATTIKASRKASAGVKHALLILLSFIAVFPLYWMIVSSFKNEAEIFGSALLPAAPTFNNISMPFSEYAYLADAGQFYCHVGLDDDAAVVHQPAGGLCADTLGFQR